MLQLLESLFQLLTEEELEEFTVVARKLWLRRNAFIFNQEFWPPYKIIREVKERIQWDQEEQGRASQQVHMHGRTTSSKTEWRPPPQDWFKVNWDGAVNKVKGFVGVGVVVRDCQGMVVATLRQRKPLIPDPFLTESYGALKVVQFARELGLSKVVLEGDSLQAIQALQGDQEVRCSSSIFLFEANLGLVKFARWEVSHIRRDGNVVAHILAKNALSILDCIITMEEYLTCISSLLK
ncbi:uncharacterized protein LOC122310146 [Carya illinoinensis]|uniref:uncharacterized protein LOC122310146 n=1 Tax=Carya illinoinensis TaxID=32201 RepID=UPI001C71F13E|nr:uncharacterized protein LOC122310146 [Carya illinoinensis]